MFAFNWQRERPSKLTATHIDDFSFQQWKGSPVKRILDMEMLRYLTTSPLQLKTACHITITPLWTQVIILTVYNAV